MSANTSDPDPDYLTYPGAGTDFVTTDDDPAADEDAG